MLRWFLCFLLTIALIVVITDTDLQGQQDIKPGEYIKVDQFGYRPQDHKVAVITDPGVGFNAQESFSPGTTYEVWDANSNQQVYSGQIQPWMDGKIHSQSGDRGWWFDFSQVKKPGSYYIIDSANQQRSVEFDVRDDVYKQVLINATRTFFYQRSGFPKQPPYADPRWTDGAAFLGPGQDTEARYVYDKDNPALARDMRGGWFDAGDTNKYVTFATPVIHQLLDAYSHHREIWTDDFNIPESGNNLPDIIDEIKYEIDWLKRMQDDDGGVFIKLGTIDHNYPERPSLDKRPRYYAPKCSSASISAAGMFAHTALVFREFSALNDYAEDLQNRAIAGWDWFQSNPKKTDCDSQEIKSGDADRTEREQKGGTVTAAVYLLKLTGDTKYNQYISANLTETQPFKDDTWSRYSSYEGDALLLYTRLANGDENIQQQISDRFREMVFNNKQSYGNSNLDPYRAYMSDPQYHWGSNLVESNYGNTNYDVLLYQVDPDHAENYKIRALDHLHYLHGVNPLSMVYLSNMYEYGAEKSANKMYHQWFGGGIYDHALNSPSGPAPGYLVGGPNQYYTGSSKPPMGEPPMKAYFDENDPNQKAWEITEPAIYYQSGYIKLLSNFVSSQATTRASTDDN